MKNKASKELKRMWEQCVEDLEFKCDRCDLLCSSTSFMGILQCNSCLAYYEILSREEVECMGEEFFSNSN